MAWKRYVTNNQDNLIINIVDAEMTNEGIGNMLSLGTLVFLLGASGMVNAEEFKRNLQDEVKAKQVEGGKVTLTTKDINNAIEKSKKDGAKEKVGSWEKDKAINVVARTLYMEARGEGTQGMRMVMTVIWNRAGGDPSKFAGVCLAPSQFSCWNDISNKSPSSYKIEFPKGATVKGGDQTAWGICSDIAQSAFDGTFTPENNTWNSYYNPDKANPSWGSEMVGTKMVGRHKVGELKWITNSVARNKRAGKNTASKPSNSTYKVKPGDTLWGIAGKDMAQVKKLKELNGLKSDVIKPGQTLKLA